jgi:hypothetical protein
MNGFSLVAAATIAILLSGCVNTPPSNTIGGYGNPAPLPARVYDPYPLSAADRAVIEQGVRSSLKDPISAIFGSMADAREHKPGSLIEVCGYVNAKNSFGGYTGNAIFYGALADKKDGGKVFLPIGSISTGDIDTSVKQQMCGRAGINL